ncbi:hypothetical protein [Amycolatopsis sp. NPDC051372]|uniref:hypothetical protein n=1 Tax=Amycolatopsis sp. NPDC051372 TaxID=3155669 RepID=UPI00341DD1D3
MNPGSLQQRGDLVAAGAELSQQQRSRPTFHTVSGAHTWPPKPARNVSPPRGDYRRDQLMEEPGVDAATAALIGAGIGVSGTVISPVITAWQGRRAKVDELRRDAYAAGISSMVGIPFAKDQIDHEAVYQAILSALGDIEMFGSPQAAQRYSDFADTLDDWRENGKVGDFSVALKEFQRITRSEIGVDRRRARIISWAKQNYSFNRRILARKNRADQR